MISKRVLGIGAVMLAVLAVMGAVWALPHSAAAQAYFGPRGADRPVAETPGGIAAILEDPYAGELSEAEVEALKLALVDEYRAWSTYETVIADFGAVRPFTNIQRAEENHIAALVALFNRYGLEVPVNEFAGNIPAFDTLAEACEAGVQAEIDNAALYDQLLSMVENPELVQVFTSLQEASQTKHLPAFERCAGR